MARILVHTTMTDDKRRLVSMFEGELRAYKHVRCTSCKQKMRVPRGKGKLRVTCPKCRTKFEVKS